MIDETRPGGVMHKQIEIERKIERLRGGREWWLLDDLERDIADLFEVVERLQGARK